MTRREQRRQQRQLEDMALKIKQLQMMVCRLQEMHQARDMSEAQRRNLEALQKGGIQANSTPDILPGLVGSLFR